MAPSALLLLRRGCASMSRSISSNNSIFSQHTRRQFSSSSSSSSSSCNGITGSVKRDSHHEVFAVNQSSPFASYFSIQGLRPYMEDTSTVSSPNADFIAVFDGHGGAKVSMFCEKNFYQTFKRLFSEENSKVPSENGINDTYNNSSKNIEMALSRTVSEIDSVVIRNKSCEREGSTASVLVIGAVAGNKIYITCNVGDSRVVLSRKGKAVDLTEDHCPSRLDEQARIKKAGGFVRNYGVHRVNGILSLSRAIGDLYLRPSVIALPDIVSHKSSPEDDDFIIVSTDGLWHVFTSQEAVDFVHLKLSKAGSDEINRAEARDNMSKMLILEALKKGGDDNLSVVVRWLKNK